MAVGIGAGGILGIALETVSGTYLAPTKFVPIDSESLKHMQDNFKRRAIRNTPGLIGVTPGNVHVEGDITFDLTGDVLAHFLYATRCTVVKTGAGPYNYVGTPAALAVPVKTLSISIKRNSEVFGYVGCIVGGLTISVGTDGILKCTVKIIGLQEATQAALTAAWPTTAPFGAGMYNLQIPTATQVYDTDTFEFSSEDNATPQFRLKNTGRGAQFASFGESNATAKVERDFENRTDYDLYKAATAQSITFVATSGADVITILMPAAIKDTYDLALPGQGDLLRASISYDGAIDSTGKHYLITVVTAENIV